MAFTVEDGTGVAGANSYQTVAGADAWHADHGNPAVWSSSTLSEKEFALVEGTAYIDRVYGGGFPGYRVSRTQGLEWPRNGASDRDDNLIDSDEVPSEVKDAASYLALKVRQGDTLSPDLSSGSVGITREEAHVGPVGQDVSYAGVKSPFKAYPTVSGLLSRILQPDGEVIRG